MNTKYATQQKPEDLELFSEPKEAIIIFKSTKGLSCGGGWGEGGCAGSTRGECSRDL